MDQIKGEGGFRIFKVLTLEWLLFFIVFAAIFLKLPGIIGVDVPTGWDTPVHYLALEKMATQYLPQFKLSGYAQDWYGGFPLFTFYPPLFFVVVSLLWYAVLKVLPLALVYRAAILLAIWGSVVAFWYFIKAFLGRSVAKWSIPASLVLIFSPRVFLSLGVANVLWVGEVSNFISAQLLLFFLALLENYRVSSKRRYFLAATFALTAIFLMHPIFGVAAGVLLLIYIAVYPRFFWEIVKICLLGTALASFWLLPFYYYYSAGLTTIIPPGASTGNPLQMIFPFSFERFSLGSFFSTGQVFYLLLLAAAVFGLVELFRGKRYFLPAALIASLLLLPTNLGAAWGIGLLQFQPDRFLSVVQAFAMAVAVFGVFSVFSRLKERYSRIVAVLFLLAAVVFVTLSFNVNSVANVTYEQDVSLYNMPFHWNFSDYPLYAEGQALLAEVKKLDPQRVFFANSSTDDLSALGSTNYFLTFPPLGGENVVYGLYLEAPSQMSVVTPTLAAIDPSGWWWGDLSLGKVPAFAKGNSFDDYVERLRLFGVSHIVFYIKVLDEERLDPQHSGNSYKKDSVGDLVKASPLLSFAGGTKDFKIYAIKDPKPLVYRSDYKPAIFFGDGSGRFTFQDLTKALYASTTTFDFPVVQAPFDLKTFLGLTDREREEFSFIIINGNLAGEGDFSDILKTNPVVLLNSPAHQGSPSGNEFVQVGPIVGLDQQNIFASVPYEERSGLPVGWGELESAIYQGKEKFPLAPALVNVSETSGDEKLTFQATGPVVVNLSYFPYWQNQKCLSGGACGPLDGVFQVTPGQMLVFSDGSTTLAYAATPVKKVATVVSWGALAVFMYLVFGWRKRANKQETSSGNGR